ncbi:PREDICTED: FXYD domain-containing ion transport regulator 5 [Propithecus coquereli]|uniref:FXYD domain-containing ion transport regulator 5 n=1 Tax=Propithecus coquereli TaxID=379532 RepID=UPI00063FB1E1|nr:PREDICTED: FXYD domain-containing ion transport regulator 5 [Propithecus coquereli]XP_012506933.1 PREDICTED: FXYD domain-containing ion transport regulator 5 [Propithecus coquereli]
MSPSGRLCLLTIVGLILPTRGQTLQEATPISPDPTTEDIHILTPIPDTGHPELQPTPRPPAWPADETTQNPTETLTQTQQPTGADGLPASHPGAHNSTEEGTTMLSKRTSPGTDVRKDPQTPKPHGSDEDNPFFYDESTLRKRGLLVAAVLFITGIVILTSGKCRQLSQLCRNHRR